MTDIVAAVQSSRRQGLEAIRDKLAADLDECDPSRSAPLAKQLVEVLREIEGLAAPKESVHDDLASRRAERRAAAASQG